MKLTDIKSPEDVLLFMKENIQYGWIDINNQVHVKEMKNFRKLYRTSSIDETLKYGIGTCIEQVILMKTLLDMINIPSRMFCTRIYEDASFNKLDEEEHMHCFILYYKGGKVWQIEHPNYDRTGIYGFSSLEEAIHDINIIYESMSGGHARPVTEFFEVTPGLSFMDFNLYINSLDANLDNNKSTSK